MKRRPQITADAHNLKTIQNLFHIGMARDVGQLMCSTQGIHLNLGAGNGYKTLLHSVPLDYPAWDAEKDMIPFENETIQAVHAYHFMEHIKNIKFLLSEIDRVLVPGGYCNIVVPYYNSQLQHDSFDHVTWFTEKSFNLLFEQYSYEMTDYEFSLEINFQMIMGIVERNMCLMVQLVKTGKSND